MSSAGTPRRVRVTGPRTGSATGPATGNAGFPPRAPRQARDMDQGTRVGQIFVASLLREQLWLAARTLGTLALVVGGLPLLFHLAPGLTEVTLVGIPLPWLLLGVGVYPVLLLLGWRHVVRVERVESDFVDLLRETESDPDR